MVKQIIKEAMEKNPIGLKESVEAELRTRVSLALEAKMKKEDEHEDDEDEDLQESHKEKLGGASYVASYEHNEKYRYFSQEAKKTKNPLYKKVADAHKKAIDAYDKVQDAANNEKTTNNQVERLYNKATDLGDVAEKITRGV